MILPRLKEVRLSQALSMEELTKQSGVSSTTIIRAERGLEVYPTTVRKLAKALDVAPSVLIESAPVEPEQPPPSPVAPTSMVRPVRGDDGPPGLAPLLRKAEECRLRGDLAGAARWQQHADELVEAAERGSVE